MNTVILSMVLGLALFFAVCEAHILVAFSVPTIMVYLINYYLIQKGKLNVFIELTFFWITIYMGITTVCLGTKPGFHLYSMSLIPVVFVTEYMAYKLRGAKPPAVRISMLIVLIYLCCIGFSFINGPLYEITDSVAILFWMINAVIVFGFLIFYSNILVNMVMESEMKLTELAHYDRLTHLYNRHYMLERFALLEEINKEAEEKKQCFIAMLDIDNFKKINDTYGHSAGDYVLSHLAEMMQKICSECEICRWGGEEFLVLSSGNNTDYSVVETLRKQVEESEFVFEGTKINVTVTIGIGLSKDNQSFEEQIKEADRKLYYGKNNGKNQVVV